MAHFTDQLALTVIAPIDTACKEKLEKLLADRAFNPLSNMPGLHFGRILLLENETLLVYSVNHDGTLKEHLNIISKIPGFAEVFSCCAGYSAQMPPKLAIPEFVKKHRQKVHAFYRGYRGLSVDEILLEKEMYESIQRFLDSTGRNIPPAELYRRIKDHIRTTMPALSKFKPYRLRFISPAALRLLFFIPPLLLIICGLFWAHWLFGIAFLAFIGIVIRLLRYKEKHDVQLADNDISMGGTNVLMSNEDFIAQNQMTHYVPVKPGRLRLFFLRLGLCLVNLQAIYSFNKGTLSGISSIHFARWLVINKGKNLLFFSNFDGTWENYLSDFVDRATEGLTLIWSNTIEFPHTRFLFNNGASDEERFKNWTRKYQVPTHKWHSAYKDLTVKNIIRNHRIRMSLQENMHAQQASEWLKLL